MAWGIRVAIATLCPLVHGCGSGKDGAVELSWSLRPASSEFNKKFVDCNPGLPGTGRVAEIELDWTVGTGDAATMGSMSWQCDDNHGATKFEVPAGTAELSVRPLCAVALGGTEPAVQGTYIAPAMVERQVIRGETVSLGAIEIVVSVSNCTTRPGDGKQPCICCPVVGMCPR
ncbi:MAG TPA: hypothetical protein VF469_13630 [Kofleriaceae bacterium]